MCIRDRGGGLRRGRRPALAVGDGAAAGGEDGGVAVAVLAALLAFAAAGGTRRGVAARSSGAKGRVSRVPLRVTLTLMYSAPSASGLPTSMTAPVPPARRRTRGVAPLSSWARKSATSASVRAGSADPVDRAAGMSTCLLYTSDAADE